MRSNWLPFYRPYSFASQPFDCFAEDIQFCASFFFWVEILRTKKGVVLQYTQQNNT